MGENDSNYYIYVIRIVDYDGGRRGKVWGERFCKNKEIAEKWFSQFSQPRVYGNRKENFVEHTKNNSEGLVKSVCCRTDMIVVEMCRVKLEEL